jgi:hypothetical protein
VEVTVIVTGVGVTEIPPDIVALTSVVPNPAAVARPDALIVAVAVVAEFHVALLVKFCIDPSVYEPITENCTVLPGATVGFFGDMATESRFGGATVRVCVPLTPLNVARSELVPAATPVARPLVETVALVVSLDAQVAVDETSLVEPSL